MYVRKCRLGALLDVLLLMMMVREPVDHDGGGQRAYDERHHKSAIVLTC